MRKLIAFFFFLAVIITSTTAQVKSPDDFLGYKIGSKYTPHWKVVSYFQQVAAAVPSMVKLQQYGTTNEGRPLMVAFVSSAENISNLENIRQNNLRLANSSLDKVAASENAPAIVWLSYNVHGNETSSSEASMLTIFSLVDPANTQTKEWLKNTVVVIDPCMNPDGRDRYVNWFNSIVGKNANARTDAREHREPWPGGRSNHYNFDLNRDWAWQTQIESQQRLKIYNQWLPQVHVDFHEQGINNPYYFAPAAQPYHEVITPWQREFQVEIGKNHAKYFDKNGWLYFTKEVFDLFYPSYGDTYPIYSGAIGMTYEQGGNGSAGTAVLKADGDTLTLYDRLIHHYTTGLSTVEISSVNASRLIKEYRKFYNDAVSTGLGTYKSFVIKTSAVDEERIGALIRLLEKNNISYGTASGNYKGYNYATGKEENFSVAKGDIVISALQPKSALVGVLFEPQSKLVDSATYDITAWSLPYIYGLNGFASKEKINTTAFDVSKVSNNLNDAYGYVIRWQGMNDAKAVSQLLQKGIKIRYAEEPFELNGQQFDRGSVIILKTGNTALGNQLSKTVADIANANNVKVFSVTSGFVDKGFDFGSEKTHFFGAPNVALVTGEGVGSNAAGEVWHFMEQQLDYPVTLINANDLSRANWNKIDVLIMPDGNYRFLSDKKAADDFLTWIQRGGKVIAMEGAVAQLSKQEWSIKSKKEDDDKKTDDDDYSLLKKYEDRERSSVSGSTPGAILKVELDNTHPLAFGYPTYYYTLKQDNTVYSFIKDGWNVGVIKKNSPVAGFIGANLKPKLKDALVLGVQDIGNGSVVYFTDNLLFRNFLENSKLIFCNALFFVGQ